MGFYDCMKKYQSNPIQIHRNARSKFPWELDHMFVTDELYDRLKSISVFVDDHIISLSDHNPIVADFESK